MPLTYPYSTKIRLTHMRIIGIGILSLMVFGLGSCSRNQPDEVQHAIYYWKSADYMSDTEAAYVDSLQITKLYMKFFEVNYSAELSNYPESKMDWWRADVPDNIQEVVPTVYLRNVVFLKSTKEELDNLADNVYFLINKFADDKFRGRITVNEMQMDCDWTPTSKDNYFYFLEKLKAISGKHISCTLRLYPYKYRETMGIPPVDKVTLMCYNLLNPFENPNKVSILDMEELEAYLRATKQYPIHIDVALPVYSWAQVYHNEKFSEVMYPDTTQFKNFWNRDKPLWYNITQDTIINNVYLREGDKIKYEEISEETLQRAITILKKYIDFDDQTTVALYHLDETQLKHYSYEDLSSFYSRFSE